MSAPKVNVLAVMEKAAKELRHWQRDHGEDIRTKESLAGLREARTAVAELIEVAASALYDMREVRDRCTSLVAVGLDEQVVETIDRLGAALARIGGAE